MTIRVLVNGAAGKMGSEAVTAIKNDPDLEFAAGANRTDNLSSLIKENNATHIVDDVELEEEEEESEEESEEEEEEKEDAETPSEDEEEGRSGKCFRAL